MGANLPRRRPAAGQEPVQRSDDGEVRLWHLGAALAVSFTVAVVDLAGLAWPAWFLLGVAGYRHNGRLRSRELACTKPLVNVRSPLYQVNSKCIETDRRLFLRSRRAKLDVGRLQIFQICTRDGI